MKTGQKILNFFIIILVIVGIVWFIFGYEPAKVYDNIKEEYYEETIVEKYVHVPSEKDTAIEEIKNRHDFKERMQIEAENIYWKEKKEEVSEEHNRKMEEIEAELEKIRSKEIGF